MHCSATEGIRTLVTPVDNRVPIHWTTAARDPLDEPSDAWRRSPTNEASGAEHRSATEGTRTLVARETTGCPTSGRRPQRDRRRSSDDRRAQGAAPRETGERRSRDQEGSRTPSARGCNPRHSLEHPVTKAGSERAMHARPDPEQSTGIEPAPSEWRSEILPLDDDCEPHTRAGREARTLLTRQHGRPRRRERPSPGNTAAREGANAPTGHGASSGTRTRTPGFGRPGPYLWTMLAHETPAPCPPHPLSLRAQRAGDDRTRLSASAAEQDDRTPLSASAASRGRPHLLSASAASMGRPHPTLCERSEQGTTAPAPASAASRTTAPDSLRARRADSDTAPDSLRAQRAGGFAMSATWVERSVAKRRTAQPTARHGDPWGAKAPPPANTEPHTGVAPVSPPYQGGVVSPTTRAAYASCQSTRRTGGCEGWSRTTISSVNSRAPCHWATSQQ